MVNGAENDIEIVDFTQVGDFERKGDGPLNIHDIIAECEMEYRSITSMPTRGDFLKDAERLTKYLNLDHWPIGFYNPRTCEPVHSENDDYIIIVWNDNNKSSEHPIAFRDIKQHLNDEVTVKNVTRNRYLVLEQVDCYYITHEVAMLRFCMAIILHYNLRAFFDVGYIHTGEMGVNREILPYEYEKIFDFELVVSHLLDDSLMPDAHIGPLINVEYDTPDQIGKIFLEQVIVNHMTYSDINLVIRKFLVGKEGTRHYVSLVADTERYIPHFVTIAFSEDIFVVAMQGLIDMKKVKYRPIINGKFKL